MSRIAVYGASGYTGRVVAAEVARGGHEVVLAGRDEAGCAREARSSRSPRSTTQRRWRARSTAAPWSSTAPGRSSSTARR